MKDDPLVLGKRHIQSVTRDTAAQANSEVLATRDPEIIREWARRVGAEPATGEASASGPDTALKVCDGGTGLRFNFPGVGRFRTIAWSEWFDHFNRYDLTFIYDNALSAQPPSARYRLVPTADLAHE